MAGVRDLLASTLDELLRKELKRFRWSLNHNGFKHIPKSQLENGDVPDTVDQMLQTYGAEEAVTVTLHILRNINQNDLAQRLEKDYSLLCSAIETTEARTPHQVMTEVQNAIKRDLKRRFEKVSEGHEKLGKPAYLDTIYTDLYITDGESEEVHNEHEMRQIETASRMQARKDVAISCNDIFNGQNSSIRTVLTKGIAGIGKTVSVQKFILDWANTKANQDVHFLFAFPFRVFNLMKKEKCSLIKLLHRYHPEFRRIRSLEGGNVKVVFIFDGLDECQLPLDFLNYESCYDIAESVSVDVLLTNLIKGNLLPSALLWITSRPAAANQIPREWVDKVTEIRGFNDSQKEEYFRKRIRDETLASRIITHVKSTRSLYIMCHIPVFCWISATFLEAAPRKAESREIPKTLTEMYTCFIFTLTKYIGQKYSNHNEQHVTNPLSNADGKYILKLGELAFQQLETGNLIFYEKDLRRIGTDVNAASVHSGLCTELFRESLISKICKGRVFSFMHMTVQEYLAALYVFLSFWNNNRNMLEQSLTTRLSLLFKPSLFRFHKTALDQALKSQTGHLDLFLRFLLDLSLESNHSHLEGLLKLRHRSSESMEKTVKYIKQKIVQSPPSERIINLFHCLNELNETSLVKEIQAYLTGGKTGREKLTLAHWSALAFILLTSEKDLDEFVLQKYNTSDEGLVRLVSVVKYSRRADLSRCNLTERCCDVLASVLSSSSSKLRELNLGGNDLQDSGVKLLSVGLGDPHCKLEKLNFSGCKLTERCCDALASVLSFNSSQLRELDLSDNYLQDSGIKLLSAGLEDPHCKLEKLNLRGCNLTERCCDVLASVLSSSSSKLRELNLSGNYLQDSGVMLLSVGLGDPHCKLEKLSLIFCGITKKGCAVLGSALHVCSSPLKELKLNDNDLKRSSVKLLSALQQDPQHRLETLEYENFDVLDIN